MRFIVRSRRQIVLYAIFATLGAVVLSAAMTYALSSVFTRPFLRETVLIGIVIPFIIAPLITLFVSKQAYDLYLAYNEIETLSKTDQLTGMYNRHYFIDMAEKQMAIARRYQQPFSVLIIDFDHFKQINDRFGHLAGDLVLKEAAALIQHQVRQSDSAARYGGEEIVVLCSNTTRDKAIHIAERIRAAV